MKRAVILGRGASRKSTLARCLGEITGLPVIELDKVFWRPGLRRADAVIFLDFSLGRRAWRAILRSRERADFWRWLFAYRRQSRPFLMEAIASHAGGCRSRTRNSKPRN
jgi:hypothetical protein